MKLQTPVNLLRINNKQINMEYNCEKQKNNLFYQLTNSWSGATLPKFGVEPRTEHEPELAKV